MRQFTKYVIISFVALITIYDLLVYLFFGLDVTVSSVVLEYSRDYTIIVLLVGIVIGHLFWPQYINSED